MDWYDSLAILSLEQSQLCLQRLGNTYRQKYMRGWNRPGGINQEMSNILPFFPCFFSLIQMGQETPTRGCPNVPSCATTESQTFDMGAVFVTRRLFKYFEKSFAGTKRQSFKVFRRSLFRFDIFGLRHLKIILCQHTIIWGNTRICQMLSKPPNLSLKIFDLNVVLWCLHKF